MLEHIDGFYQKFSRHLLLLMLISLPVLAYEAAQIPMNNDVETWLPAQSELKLRYDRFRQDFGSEEMLVLGFKKEANNPQLVTALAERLETLEGVRQAWDSKRFRAVMRELQVPEEAIQDRLIGMTESIDGNYRAILVLLSEQGTADRGRVVQEIRNQLEYCQVDSNQYAFAGGPVIVSELNRLGGPENNRKFFLLTLFLGFLMLLAMLRDWRTSAAMILLTVWAIQATTAGVKLLSGEMNFILGALPVMVMVFTLAIAIHFLHYFDTFRNRSYAVALGLSAAWKPCLFATLTTTIGLASLCMSDIMPVRQFGYAASLGCVISMVTALVMMPAVVTALGFSGFGETSLLKAQRSIFAQVIRFRYAAVVIPLTLVAVTGIAVPQLRSRLEPLDFLPSSNKVLTDFQEIQENLTTLDSIEIIVDFDGNQGAFLDRMDEVRAVERLVSAHPWVRRTSSPASFFPTIDQMPESTREIGSLLKTANSRADESDYLACGQRFWRISARIEPEAREHQTKLVSEIQESLKDYQVEITGISPLVKQAQDQIFDGFWSSFGTAFLIITVVMMIALRSITIGLFAMIPNLTPLLIVFGLLAWFEVPIDIGMMMSGSIALGIAVDGTFHFLMRYESELREEGDSAIASAQALDHTGPAIAEAAIIAAVGMMALSLSQFAPTARFGMLMTGLLMAALIGDLVLLPAMLALRSRKHSSSEEEDRTVRFPLRGPHYIPSVRDYSSSARN
ncbi:MMPL family transporter [Rubinisphaera sp.]|uniref:efflux RND transporter permease subunit n=1 Tax=Rubinisphaera sp. TaxID=2024857 RepID=UPI000C10C356|nr:MMPL family transporter [Rubinisphaera sp.]MBV09805.1 RND transporter [Rubinisphaera sp.]HCS54832.1 RND transporter [Planctomycetaceae bacterium]